MQNGDNLDINKIKHMTANAATQITSEFISFAMITLLKGLGKQKCKDTMNEFERLMRVGIKKEQQNGANVMIVQNALKMVIDGLSNELGLTKDENIR